MIKEDAVTSYHRFSSTSGFPQHKTKYFIQVGIFLSILFFLFSCVKIEEYENTPRGNFEALWKTMDEKYCFFSYKDINWNEVYHSYASQVDNVTTNEELFQLLNEMLQELKDGHVNLITPFDLGRYWKWFEDYPDNFDRKIIDKFYLGTDYAIASGMRYKILEDSIGYIYYGDFSAGISPISLDYILKKFAVCDGIIIDVRNNGGGTLTNVTEFASRFTNEKILTGYIQHKTGKGHNDFSELFPKYIEPSTRIHFEKPVVVLTNRKCYSATNEFVSVMRLFPLVTIMGDRTGGGSGLPMSSELPNGWAVRFSACPNFDENKLQIEFGIDPDIFVEWDDEKTSQDSFIETARSYLHNEPEMLPQ